METITLDNINYVIFQSDYVERIEFKKLIETLKEFEIYEGINDQTPITLEKLREKIIFIGENKYDYDISNKIFKYFSKEMLKGTVCLECESSAHAHIIIDALKYLEYCCIYGIGDITLYIIHDENIRILYIDLATESG